MKTRVVINKFDEKSPISKVNCGPKSQRYSIARKGKDNESHKFLVFSPEKEYKYQYKSF